MEVVELEIVEKKGGERDKESRGISIGGRGQDMGWFLEFNQRRRGGGKSGGWKLLAMARYMGDPLRE